MKSGVVAQIPSLYQMCIRILQKNIDGKTFPSRHPSAPSNPSAVFFSLGTNWFDTIRHSETGAAIGFTRTTVQHRRLQSVSVGGHRHSMEIPLRKEIPEQEAARIGIVARHVSGALRFPSRRSLDFICSISFCSAAPKSRRLVSTV